MINPILSGKINSINKKDSKDVKKILNNLHEKSKTQSLQKLLYFGDEENGFRGLQSFISFGEA